MNNKPDLQWAEGMPVFAAGWTDQQVIIALTPTMIILRSGERYYRYNGFRVGDIFPWGRVAIHPDTPEMEHRRYEAMERRRLTMLVHNACFGADVTIPLLTQALAILRSNQVKQLPPACDSDGGGGPT